MTQYQLGKTASVPSIGLLIIMLSSLCQKRNSFYFLRGYDYVFNKVLEFPIDASSSFDVISVPFVNVAPQIDVIKNPKSFSPEFFSHSIRAAILKSKKNKNYIRIKYKNRNEEITIRSIKEYKLVKVNEQEGEVHYLIGFCMLRQDQRTFKVNRIIKLQELSVPYSSLKVKKETTA